MKINILSLIAVVITVSFFSCSKETAVGTEIIQVEGVNIFSEDFALDTKTFGSYEVTPAYYSGLDEDSHLLGKVTDPYLGTTESKLYFNFLPGKEFDYKGATLDSVVLNLKIDTANIVGARREFYDIEVKALKTNIHTIDTIFNDTELLVNDEVLGSKSDFINFDNSTKYYSVTVDSVITVAPQLRIKLDDQFGEALMADSLIAKENDEFLAKYNGFEITAVPQNNNVMPITLDSETNITLYNSVELYYTNSDNEKMVAYYSMTTTNFNIFNVDHTGSPSLEQFENGDKSYIYQQTLGGAYSELLLPDLSMFKNDSIAINSAVIELEQATLENDLDSEMFPYLDAFYLNHIDPDTNEEKYIIDITNKLTGDIGIAYHNGTLEDNKVIFNCTDQISNYINGKTDNRLIIKNTSINSTVAKSIFYGADNQNKSPKLKLTYTKI